MIVRRSLRLLGGTRLVSLVASARRIRRSPPLLRRFVFVGRTSSHLSPPRFSLSPCSLSRAPFPSLSPHAFSKAAAIPEIGSGKLISRDPGAVGSTAPPPPSIPAWRSGPAFLGKVSVSSALPDPASCSCVLPRSDYQRICYSGEVCSGFREMRPRRCRAAAWIWSQLCVLLEQKSSIFSSPFEAFLVDSAALVG